VKTLIKKMSFCILVPVVFSILSCAFPFQGVQGVNLNDIGNLLTYEEISRQAFMGGSVLYNPAQPSSGQLAAGVRLAVRLGKVTKEVKSTYQVVYTEIEDMASYGYITIESIDKKGVRFSYTSFSGGIISNFVLPIGGTVDINKCHAAGFYRTEYYPV
jgi:hypothetical protein